MPTGAYSSTFFTTGGAGTSRHIFWGELAGALESLDAGTTTVVDHSHCNVSGNHNEAKTAVTALGVSGLRGVYCYQPPRRATSFEPLVLEEKGPLDEDVRREYEGLYDAVEGPLSSGRGEEEGEGENGGGRRRRRRRIGDGRVMMGFAMDTLFLPTEELKASYAYLRGEEQRQVDNKSETAKTRRRRAKLITSHAPGGPGLGGSPYAVGILDRAGLLGPDTLLSHAPGLEDEDIAALRRAGAFVSSTPNTEMQMGMEPVSMWRSVLLGHNGDNDDTAGASGLGSLGVDCHTWGTSYLPTQMNLMLQQRRLSRALEVAAENDSNNNNNNKKKKGWVRHVEGTPEQAFNLGTISGARAIGSEHELGRLQPGYKADLLIFSGTSPGMLAAAQQDPVAAVVLHSSIRDVETVIVDGVVRKEGGRLCDVAIVDDDDDHLVLDLMDQAEVGHRKGDEQGVRISWEDVVRELGKSREEILDRMKGINFGPAEEATIDAWHMDRAAMVDR